jgi:hypothetical protein
MSDDGFRYRDLDGQPVDDGWAARDAIHRPRLRVIQPGEVAPEPAPEPIATREAAMRPPEARSPILRPCRPSIPSKGSAPTPSPFASS